MNNLTQILVMYKLQESATNPAILGGAHKVETLPQLLIKCTTNVSVDSRRKFICLVVHNFD